MLIVRDTRTGEAVTWGTDHQLMREIAASNPNYVTMNDLGAARYYCHVVREGQGWIHPYDRDAMHYTRIKP